MTAAFSRHVAFATLCLISAGNLLAQAPPPPGGSSGNDGLRSVTDMVQFDYRSQVAVAPGVPESSIFAGFENNENVQLYNGNLLVSHPSTITYPVNGGGSIGLSRVYNSMNVIDRQISLSADPSDKKSIISGKSWVGIGWQMHLGRIYMESIERRGTVGCNPGCIGQPHDPCYQNSEYFFEAPDGTRIRFASTDPDGGCGIPVKNDTFAGNEVTRELQSGQDHPVLRVRYFKEPGGKCELSGGKPVWCAARTGPLPAECTHYGNQCQVSADGTAHYLVELEDGTELRLEKQQEIEEGSRKFIRNRSNNGWYATRIRYPGKTPAGDTIINVNYHRPACVASGTAGCDLIYPYGEAIKEITSPTHPEIHIWTDLWLTGDAGLVPSTNGMLKAIHSAGPAGQTVTYRYFYSWENDQLDETSEPVPILIRVELPSPGQATPYAIKYEYRTGFDAIFMDAPGTSFLLDKIVYPLGGESAYTYGQWGCGPKKRCNPASGNCDELNHWAVNERHCRGVIRRDLTLGTAGQTPAPPVATSYWQRRWTARQCGEDPVDDRDVENRFAFISADRRHQTSELVIDPCREAVMGPHDKRVAGKFKYERTFAGADESTVLRTVEYGYEMERGSSAPYASLDTVASAIPPTFARDVTTTYHDDFGACFGAGTAGTQPKKMELHHRLRDDWNNWRLVWERGDYVKQTSAGPVNRIAFVDYYSPFNLPSKLLDRHEFGAYSRAFAEEGSGTANQSGNELGRYEVNYKFEGVDTSDGGLGEVKEIVAKDDWRPATTRLDTDPPQTTANAAADSTDLKSLLQFNANGNVERATFSGGDADPVTAQRKTYEVSYTWQQGVASTLRIEGLSFDSAKVTPDHGSIVASEDSNGLVTGYSFDTLGRPTTIDPPGTQEQATRVIYPSLREMRVIRSAGTETDFLNVTDNSQVFSSQEYDEIGRTIKRTSALPGAPDGSGKRAIQIVRYDQVGREIFVSEWMTQEDYDNASKLAPWYEPNWDRDGDGTADPAKYWVGGIPKKDDRPWGTTTFYGTPSSTDPANPLLVVPDGLGRIRQVIKADGSIVERTYCGPHVEETVHNVRTAIEGSNQYNKVSTRQYFDAFGNLVAVDTEPLSGQTGAAVGTDAIYDYDARGKLKKATLYPSNALAGNPFEAWRTGSRPPGGQTRTFNYSAVGRLVSSTIPEKGTEQNRLYDAWGNLLAWQDQLGLDRDYFFRQTYDIAGRLLSEEKRAGRLVGETIVAAGPAQIYADSFTGSLDPNWTEGWFDNKRFRTFGSQPTPAPQDGQWDLAPASNLGCLPAPPDSPSGNVLYFGASCSYSGALAAPEAMRRKLVGVRRDDTISLKIFRSTRESGTLGAGSRDEIAIWVLPDSTGDVDADGTPDNLDLDQRRVVYSASEAQAVFSRWYRTPAIRPADLFADWGASEQRSLWLFIVFTKGDTQTANLGAGVAVDDLYVGRADVELLTEQTWDQSICSLGLGGDACADASEPADRARDRVTTVKSYQDGQLAETRYMVYRGLNGRVSGVRQLIDWTGLARAATSSDWSDFVTRMTYTERGLPLDLVAPSVAGVTGERRYRNSYRRDHLTGIEHVGTSLKFLKSGVVGGVEYDAAGLPTKLLFQNDTTQVITRDAMFRVRTIKSTLDSNATTLFDTSSYAYDGAGNIASIGAQQFSYDQAGRLVNAWMKPIASDPLAASLHKISYVYDGFGNILSQTMAQGSTPTPLGFNVLLTYDPSAANNGQDNKNRITSSGTVYDSNGNSLRYTGQQQQPAASVWDPRNRMRGFIAGNPDVGAGIVQQYTYNSAGQRIVRIGNEGKPIISLRNDNGDTLADFAVNPGSSNPTLTKDFIYGLDQLLVERTVSVMHPTMTTNSVLKTGSFYNFKLTSGTGHASYVVDISASSGWRRQVLGIQPDSAGVFSVAESELSPNEASYIRVRIDAPVASPYSPPVTLVYDTTVSGISANQIRALSVSRNGTDVILRWALNQSNGKSTRLYFRRADGTATYLLTPQTLPANLTEFTLNSQALSSPCGSFYGTQFNVGVETGASREADLGSSQGGEQGTQDGCGGSPPPGSPPAIVFSNAYRHLDHLGSLRVETGEGGFPTARLDYYPYGHDFASNVWGGAAGLMRFTSKERDAETGLDFFGARYMSSAQGRFTSPDAPFADQHPADPQSWNLYSYSRNNPLRYVDPTGRGAVSAGVKAAARALEKKLFTAARAEGVRRAWKQEVELVRRTGQGSREWTKAQVGELMTRGKVKGFEGHHINSVKGNDLAMAADPNNIKFVEGRAGNLAEHGGNFQNETSGGLIDRIAKYGGPGLLAFFATFDQKMNEYSSQSPIISSPDSWWSNVNPANYLVENAALAEAFVAADNADREAKKRKEDEEKQQGDGN